MCHLCPASQFRDGLYGLAEDSSGRSQVLIEGNSRCHHEERGKAEEEGGELGCPGPGVYTDAQKERGEA